jgi:hypothetical protein
VNAYTLLSTVAEHKKLFTKRQVDDADAARTLYRKIGRPDEAEFQSILRGNCINNCPALTVVSTADRSYKTILNGVLAAIKTYQDRALRVQGVHADSEFECIQAAIKPTELNVVPPDSHVGEVERSVRTIKDTVWRSNGSRSSWSATWSRTPSAA